MRLSIDEPKRDKHYRYTYIKGGGFQDKQISKFPTTFCVFGITNHIFVQDTIRSQENIVHVLCCGGSRWGRRKTSIVGCITAFAILARGFLFPPHGTLPSFLFRSLILVSSIERDGISAVVSR